MPLKIGLATLEFNNMSNTLLVSGGGQPGPPEFSEIIVNPDSEGNDRFDIVHDRQITNTAGGILDGYTIETSFDGSSWFEVDKTNMTAVIRVGKIQVTNGGNAVSIDSQHRFRVAYNSGAGNIVNKFHPADALATFSATESTTNNSTIDMTRGQGDAGGAPAIYGDHYDLSEAAATTREPYYNTGISGYDMISFNGSPTRTHPRGSGLTLDCDETGYLKSTDAWGEEDVDNNSGGAWVILDALPSSLNGGSGRDAYVLNRWSSTNDRSHTITIWGRQSPALDDRAVVSIHNSANSTFSQTRGSACPTGTWFYLGWSHDSSGDAGPGDNVALKLYYRELAGSMETITNALGGAAVAYDMKKPTVAVAGSLGHWVGNASDLFNGGIAEGYVATGETLTQAEHSAISEYPRPYPYFIDLV